MGSVDDDKFCADCEVRLDLHDGPDTCDLAESKALLLERFGGALR